MLTNEILMAWMGIILVMGVMGLPSFLDFLLRYGEVSSSKSRKEEGRGTLILTVIKLHLVTLDDGYPLPADGR